MTSQRTVVALGFTLLTSGLSAATATGATAVQPAKVEKKTVSSDTTLVNKDAQVVKVGCVNTFDAMQMSETGKAEAQRIDKVRKDLTDAIQKKEQLLTAKMNDFKEQQSTFTTAAREKKESEIIEMRRDLENTIQGSEEQLKLAMQRATEKLSKEIEQAVTQIAQNQGFDFVTDIYTGRPIFASDKMLLTADLIDVMNVNHASSKIQAPAAAPQKAVTA